MNNATETQAHPEEIRAEQLLSLEEYRAQRDKIRSEVLALKKKRLVKIGEHITLQFENRETIFYQIMEMLRIEKTQDAAGIAEELSAYNPLIPDAGNLKATMMIEYDNPTQRAVELQALKGVERKVFCAIDGLSSGIYAIADEDMTREDGVKTSAVHFLRFPIDQRARALIGGGAALAFGCDHPRYHYQGGHLSTASVRSLAEDLQLTPESNS